jgi:hypothetical protein
MHKAVDRRGRREWIQYHLGKKLAGFIPKGRKSGFLMEPLSDGPSDAKRRRFCGSLAPGVASLGHRRFITDDFIADQAPKGRIAQPAVRPIPERVFRHSRPVCRHTGEWGVTYVSNTSPVDDSTR